MWPRVAERRLNDTDLFDRSAVAPRRRVDRLGDLLEILVLVLDYPIHDRENEDGDDVRAGFDRPETARGNTS